MIGTNQILTDFNLGPEDIYNDIAVRTKIEGVERVFHLVMFVEHFEVKMKAIVEMIRFTIIGIIDTDEGDVVLVI